MPAPSCHFSRQLSRLLLVVLLALLPLRGWTAERMGLGLDHGAVAVESAAAMPAVDGMPPDCDMHHASTHADAGANLHNGCQHCDLCMPLAALPALTILTPPATAQALPPALPQRFASAERARSCKPPIS